jgi:hypothetical protein
MAERVRWWKETLLMGVEKMILKRRKLTLTQRTLMIPKEVAVEVVKVATFSDCPTMTRMKLIWSLQAAVAVVAALEAALIVTAVVVVVAVMVVVTTTVVIVKVVVEVVVVVVVEIVVVVVTAGR